MRASESFKVTLGSGRPIGTDALSAHWPEVGKVEPQPDTQVLGRAARLHQMRCGPNCGLLTKRIECSENERQRGSKPPRFAWQPMYTLLRGASAPSARMHSRVLRKYMNGAQAAERAKPVGAANRAYSGMLSLQACASSLRQGLHKAWRESLPKHHRQMLWQGESKRESIQMYSEYFKSADQATPPHHRCQQDLLRSRSQTTTKWVTTGLRGPSSQLLPRIAIKRACLEAHLPPAQVAANMKPRQMQDGQIQMEASC